MTTEPYVELLRAQLLVDEGVRTHPYRDTVGKLTIGVGRNLDDVGISDGEIYLLLTNDMDRAVRLARSFSDFDALTDARKAVIANMAFNLGERLFQFVGLRRALWQGDYDGAAEHMLESKWATQVGARAVRLSNAMRKG